jgi:hypothetical protein
MAHAAPQTPQFAASVSVETQEPAQSDCPVGQLPVTQLPPWQICPPAQGRLQPPQCSALLVGLAQTPLQSSSVAAQLATHRPA